MSDKRCSLLWNHVRVHVDGTVLPCCNFDTHKLKSNHPDIPKINDGIDNAFKSEFFKNVRTDMLNGIEPAGCDSCFADERNGSESMRERFNRYYDVDVTPKIRYIETASTKHCNLACRMCHEAFSSKWFQISNPNKKVDTHVKGSSVEFYDSDLSELNYVKLVGGEPLLDKNHEQLLQRLVENDKSNKTLEYFTNGTVKPNKKIVEFWKQMKLVKVSFSIDGTEEVNEILRPPSKWETIIDTIKYFKSLEDEVNFEFNLHTVVSIGNIKNLLLLTEFCIDNFKVLPSYDFLEYPHHLSIRHQSSDVKKQLREFIDNNYYKNHSVEWVPNPHWFEEFSLLIKGILHRLDDETDLEYTFDEVIEIERNRNTLSDIEKLLW